MCQIGRCLSPDWNYEFLISFNTMYYVKIWIIGTELGFESSCSQAIFRNDGDSGLATRPKPVYHMELELKKCPQFTRFKRCTETKVTLFFAVLVDTMI